MPGMMETVLNLGLNDATIKGVIAKSNDERFAYDSYRRFLQMFGSVVLDIERDKFEEHITELKEKKNIDLDVDLSAEDWKGIVEKFKAVLKKKQEKNSHKSHSSN